MVLTKQTAGQLNQNLIMKFSQQKMLQHSCESGFQARSSFAQKIISKRNQKFSTSIFRQANSSDQWIWIWVTLTTCRVSNFVSVRNRFHSGPHILIRRNAGESKNINEHGPSLRKFLVPVLSFMKDNATFHTTNNGKIGFEKFAVMTWSAKSRYLNKIVKL